MFQQLMLSTNKSKFTFHMQKTFCGKRTFTSLFVWEHSCVHRTPKITLITTKRFLAQHKNMLICLFPYEIISLPYKLFLINCIPDIGNCTWCTQCQIEKDNDPALADKMTANDLDIYIFGNPCSFVCHRWFISLC